MKKGCEGRLGVRDLRRVKVEIVWGWRWIKGRMEKYGKRQWRREYKNFKEEKVEKTEMIIWNGGNIKDRKGNGERWNRRDEE